MEQTVLVKIARLYEAFQNAPDIDPKLVYEEWIQGIEEPMKSKFEKLGYEGSSTSMPFILYCKDIKTDGLLAYMKRNLTEEEYDLFIETRKLRDFDY